MSICGSNFASRSSILFNHRYFVGFSRTYGTVPRQDGRSDTLAGSTNQLPARSTQFTLKVRI